MRIYANIYMRIKYANAYAWNGAFFFFFVCQVWGAWTQLEVDVRFEWDVPATNGCICKTHQQ